MTHSNLDLKAEDGKEATLINRQEMTDRVKRSAYHKDNNLGKRHKWDEGVKKDRDTYPD